MPPECFQKITLGNFRLLRCLSAVSLCDGHFALHGKNAWPPPHFTEYACSSTNTLEYLPNGRPLRNRMTFRGRAGKVGTWELDPRLKGRR